MIDLHMHSEFSIDARDTPELLVTRALERGVTAMAITEHHNTDSLARGKKKARECGIEYIHGVELGGVLPLTDGPANVDILAYFFDQTAVRIKQICDRVHRRSQLHTEAFLAGLPFLRIPITRERVEAEYPGRLSGWAIRRMLRDEGYAKDKPESADLMDRAIEAARQSEPRFARLDEEEIQAKEVIEAIHADGGIAMMAHPFWLTKEARGGHPPEAVWRQIETVLELGADGLEAVNAGNDAGYSDTVLAYCQAHNLPASGGSDSHGSEGVGRVAIDDSLLQSMRNHRAGKPAWG